MFRRLGRYSFVLVVGALATVLGLGAALTLTPPGRALLARVITDQSDRLVRGGIEVARVNGTFVSSLVLDSVVVRDTSGALLALFPRVDLRYRLGSLLTGQVVFSRVHLEPWDRGEARIGQAVDELWRRIEEIEGGSR